MQSVDQGMAIYHGGKSKPDKWAILIGIDLYLPGDARGPVEAKKLYGCVNDVQQVEKYLVQFQGVGPRRIRKLCAPHPCHKSALDVPSKDPEEIWKLASHIPTEDRPTYENMVRTLQEITDEASGGDLVYIHYSGHGARIITLIPEIKKGNPFRPDRPGIDEALAPMDTNLGGRYIRDVEMAALLKRMVDKGLHVTLVLDSCHSGGFTRCATKSSDTTLRARTIDGTDADGVNWGQLPTDSSDIPRTDLRTALASQPWSHSTAWLTPNGYAMLAAVLPSEQELEIPSITGTPTGMLTHCLLKALRESNGNVTHVDLHGRVKWLVQEKLAAMIRTHQCPPTTTLTPVLMGNVGRQFFRRDASSVIHRILVSKVEPEKVQLGGGYAHGVRNGDIYSLYHWTGHDYSRVVAKVRVDKAYVINSDATVLHSPQLAPGETLAGYHAILEKRMVPGVRIQLRTAFSTDGLSHLGPESWPMITVHDDWKNEQVSQGTTILRYGVSTNPEQQYRLHNENGSAVPMLPTFPDARSLFKAASHVGQFEFFRSLRNEFSGKIKAEFRVTSNDNCQVSPDIVEIRHDQPMNLHFENKNSFRVYLTVFAMTSLWGIVKIHPSRNDFEYDEVEWAHHRDIGIRPEFPLGFSSDPFVTETLKAFITTKPTSFKMLEMTELIKGSTRGQMAQHEVSPMQGELLQTLATFDSPLEIVESVTSAREVVREPTSKRPMSVIEPQSGNGEEWQTREIEVRIHRTEKWRYV